MRVRRASKRRARVSPTPISMNSHAPHPYILRSTLIALVALVLLTVTFVPSASAAVCGRSVTYPGNSASKISYANWMANGAVVRDIPAELPVMAALVESNLQNLNYGDRDSVGFFQMRTSIWDRGQYRGYLKKPDLQLKWFLDTAAQVRLQYIAAGKPDPASSATTYGVWIADIERPAAEYRGRYQKRLAEARALIAETCPDLKRQDPNELRVAVAIPDVQRSHRSGVIVAKLRCPAEPCNATGTALLRLPGERRLTRIHSNTLMLPAGRRGAVRIMVKRALRKKLRRAVASGTIRADIRVSITDAQGRGTARSERIRLTR